MVGVMNLHKLSLEELHGVVEFYPWFSAARVELCRRLGKDMSLQELAANAIYVGDRSLLWPIARGAFSAPSPEPVREEPQRSRAMAAAGDYFSQAQYDGISQETFRLQREPSQSAAVSSAQDTAGADYADLFPTETLAQILVEQGRTEEARRIYSRLALDIPEKSAYFATLIEKLK